MQYTVRSGLKQTCENDFLLNLNTKKALKPLGRENQERLKVYRPLDADKPSSHQYPVHKARTSVGTLHRAGRRNHKDTTTLVEGLASHAFPFVVYEYSLSHNCGPVERNLILLQERMQCRFSYKFFRISSTPAGHQPAYGVDGMLRSHSNLSY